MGEGLGVRAPVSLSLQRLTVICRERQPPFHFLRLLRGHQVVKPAPLLFSLSASIGERAGVRCSISILQFFLGEFARVRATPRLGGETPPSPGGEGRGEGEPSYSH